MKYILILLLFTFCNSLIFGQLTETEVREIANRGDEQEMVYESSRILQEGYFYQSEIIVDKLLEKQPESANYNYRKGFIVLESRKDFQSAINYFEKAIVDVDKNYDLFSANEKSASLDVFYYIAKAYHMNEDLENANVYYQKFLSDNVNKKSPLIALSKLGLQQVAVAEQAMKTPKDVRLTKIGSNINTTFPDFSPVVSLDGSALYFTSKRPWYNGESDMYRDPKTNQYTEDIYVSYKDIEGNWEAPLKLELNQPGKNEATMAVSSDERRIYVYKDDIGYGDIYYSDFKTNKFADVSEFTANNVNSKSWEPHITISPDGRSGYFVSDRPGGLGGRDIYRIIKLPTGEWSEPINVGPKINTAFDEDSPFIAVDNKTLYYSSNGPSSMGGFDIFVSVRDENNVWSNSINLGYPFNSTVDDIFYTTTVDGRTGYMTSDRKGTTGEKDIYEIFNDYLGVKNIAVLKGLIKTVDNRTLPEGVIINVKCLNCGNPIETDISPRPRDGAFFTGLEPCRDYEIVYSKDGSKFHSELFRTSCEKQYDEIYREILLDVETMKVILPVDTITTVAVNTTEVKNFNNPSMRHTFGYNANKLNVKKNDLKRLLKELEDQVEDGRSKILVKISSSASQVPTKTFENNQQLAETRAENVKYDIQNYIDNNPKLKDKLIVSIVKVEVSGPVYENDAKNKDKYEPFQFVEISTE